MTAEPNVIDISDESELARLVDEVARTRQPQAIRRNGETVALLVPAGRGSAYAGEPYEVVDTSGVPLVRYRSVADLVCDRPIAPARSFTDAELKEAIADARVEAWLAKQRRSSGQKEQA